MTDDERPENRTDTPDTPSEEAVPPPDAVEPEPGPAAEDARDDAEDTELPTPEDVGAAEDPSAGGSLEGTPLVTGGEPTAGSDPSEPTATAEDVDRAEDEAPPEPEPVEPRAAEVEESLRDDASPLEEAEASAEGAPLATEGEVDAAQEVAAAAEGNGQVATEAAEAEVAPAGDPFGGPGDWYVIHTYAGYENKVKTNLETRIHTMQMEDKIFDVHIPMEDVMEIKGGKKQVVQKKVFPGYLLVKMLYDDDSWAAVRNTPGVTGFVSSGTGQRPTPLSRREVEKILAVKEEEAKKPMFRLEFEEGDVVRIISGPFADFNGTISDINVDQSKLRVMVNIFDRETPVELGFDQVAKV
ncbi:MAG TPA: transcription termination/antitermination protein NusG [Actinomycetota bacterium]|nr:transcription termination/antitermination protein NusG [Actinomycetota bacterium]